MSEVVKEQLLLSEAKKLPWQDRLEHREWIVRKHGNEDLACLFKSITDRNDPRVKEFGVYMFAKSVADSDAYVQESALEALNAFLNVGAHVGSYEKEICDAIASSCFKGRRNTVDKSLDAVNAILQAPAAADVRFAEKVSLAIMANSLIGPPNTVEKAHAILLRLLDLGAVDVFMGALEEVLEIGVAKTMVSALELMLQAIKNSDAIPHERILDILADILYHQYKSVSATAKKVIRHLCGRELTQMEVVTSGIFERLKENLEKELKDELTPDMNNPWTQAEEVALINAHKTHGKNWANILKDPVYTHTFSRRSRTDLKDKWRNMGNKMKRIEKEEMESAVGEILDFAEQAAAIKKPG